MGTVSPKSSWALECQNKLWALFLTLRAEKKIMEDGRRGVLEAGHSGGTMCSLLGLTEGRELEV